MEAEEVEDLHLDLSLFHCLVRCVLDLLVLLEVAAVLILLEEALVQAQVHQSRCRWHWDQEDILGEERHDHLLEEKQHDQFRQTHRAEAWANPRFPRRVPGQLLVDLLCCAPFCQLWALVAKRNHQQDLVEYDATYIDQLRGCVYDHIY